MHRIAQLFKASGLNDEGQEFRLTNFDVQEVSVVDQAANQEDWLVIKGMNIMTVRKLQEILAGTGIGEFVTTNKDDPAGGNAPAPGGAPSGDASTLRLSQSKKAEALQGIGTVIKALIEVAKQVDAAEVDEASTSLPEQLTTVINSASEALAKMVGNGGAAPGDGSTKNATQKKIDAFEESLGSIETMLGHLRTAFGGGEAPANGDEAPALGASGDALTADPKLAKALGDIIELAKRQGREITLLKGKLGLPAAAAAEGSAAARGSAGDEFAWPMNMNESRRSARR